MVFTQETLDLYISTALTSVGLDERKVNAMIAPAPRNE